MKEVTSKRIQSKQNRKFNEIESLIKPDDANQTQDYILIKDAKINLFTANIIKSKKDKTHYREEIVE